MSKKAEQERSDTNGKTINTAATFLVIIVAGFAFVLSYSSLRHLAQSNGIDKLAVIWPLLLDFAMIVFSLAILRANLRKERNIYPWILTIIFAGLATAANVLDATTLGISPVAIKAVVKALAPITLVLAFELLMTMLKAEEERKGAIISIDDLLAKIDEYKAEIANLEATRNRLQRQIEILESARITKPTRKMQPISANAQGKKAQNMAALLAYYAREPQSTLTAAANEIGVSRQTVANYLDELEQDGAIHRNGNGVQVLSLSKEPEMEQAE